MLIDPQDEAREALAEAIWDVTGGSREAVEECIDALGWTSVDDADEYAVIKADIRLNTYDGSEA